MARDDRPAVGLDFGTSTTLVASPLGVVPIGESQPWLPSVVGYRDDGSVVAGEAALEVAEEQAVRSVKRWITEHRDFVRIDTPYGMRDVRADDLIVELLRETARRGLVRGQDLTRHGAVWLGCPAMWDGRQRRRLVQLAQRAGLPVTLASLVDEPVAAGIAWLAHRQGRGERGGEIREVGRGEGRGEVGRGERGGEIRAVGRSEGRGEAGNAGRDAEVSGAEVNSAEALRVLVFDMGGGTLDIAVLDVRGTDVAVLAALGVAEAGDTLDHAIAEDLDYALSAVGVDIDSLGHPRRARARLAYAAREAKIGLTTEPEVDVKLSRREFGLPSIVYTRDQLNAVFEPQLDRAEQFVGAALRVARLASGSAREVARASLDSLVEGVDVVVLSGGMSQIPYVGQRLRELFPPTTTVELAANPSEHAVAIGLARAPRYGRINAYRPAFDVLLEWEKGTEHRTVYEAFTPLVEPRQILSGASELCFVRSGLDLSLPRQGKGRLRVVSHTGERIRATLGGAGLDGFPVALGQLGDGATPPSRSPENRWDEHSFEFRIYPNGRIRVTDSVGTYDGHVDGWHVL